MRVSGLCEAGRVVSLPPGLRSFPALLLLNRHTDLGLAAYGAGGSCQRERERAFGIRIRDEANGHLRRN